MKKLLFVSVCTLAFSTVSAQDLILKKNADEIKAKITKVGDTEIEYRKWDNPDGPTYVIPTHEVFVIKYQNGSTDKISEHSKRSRTVGGKYPRYQGELAFAYGIGVGDVSTILNTNRILFETVHGIRFNPYLFTGLGVGFNYFYGLLNDYYYYDANGNSFDIKDDTAGIMPVFADFRGYYPVAKKASIYLAFDMGAAIGVSGYASGTEFYTSIGPGINFGNPQKAPQGDFSIRFQHMGEGLNAILLRIGCTF